jgi:hypothetical protein
MSKLTLPYDSFYSSFYYTIICPFDDVWTVDDKLVYFVPNNQEKGSLKKAVNNGSIEWLIFRTVVSLGKQQSGLFDLPSRRGKGKGKRGVFQPPGSVATHGKRVASFSLPSTSKRVLWAYS